MGINAIETKIIKNQQYKIICPECLKKTNIIFDYNTGDIICGECGLVISEKIIDQGPGWRAYNSSERDKKAHTGSPINITISDKGLTTNIGSNNKDFYGNKIKPKKRVQIYRMRKWNNRARLHNAIDKNLLKAMYELNKLTSQLEIPKFIKEEAAFLYRRALDNGKIKGRNIIGMITAALYVTCRMHDIPRTYNDFHRYSELSKRSLTRFSRIFIETMNIKVPPADPKIFVPRFCTALKLSTHVQNKVYKILDIINQKKITVGRGTTKLVAAVIYISAILEGERRSQKEIAQVTNISEVTLRNRYRELTKFMKIRLE